MMIRHIRIVSPSGAIDPSYIDGAKARLQSWGFQVSEGSHARATWGRFAGTDEQRIDDLTQALEDPSVDALLCARGGYGMQRIIDRIPPICKPIIGFSDITALHLLAARTQQPTLHSIMCKHIATLPEESQGLQALRQLLHGDSVQYHWDAHPLNTPGQATAPIIGGNLSVLYGLQATPFALTQFINQHPILLIEDIGERHYHIDRMMQNLRLSGVLASLSGLIVGQFSDCEDDSSMNETIYETIKKVVADYNYPVLFNAPIGHVSTNVPLLLNANTTIHSGMDCSLLTNGIDKDITKI